MLKKIFMSVVAVMLVVSTLFVCAFSAQAVTKNETKKYDLVFLIDTSKSIEKNWQYVISSIRKQVKELEKNETDYRVAFIEFRSTKTVVDYTYKTSDFMSDSETISKYLDTIKLSKSAYSSSCLFSALIDGTKKITFRHNAVRALFIFAVTPCSDPEPRSGYTYNRVRTAFSINTQNTLNCPYKFYTYNFGTDSSCAKYCQLLASDTGGKYTSMPYSSTSDFDKKFDAALSKDMSTVTTLKVIEMKQSLIERIEDMISSSDSKYKAVLKVFVILYKMMFR